MLNVVSFLIHTVPPTTTTTTTATTTTTTTQAPTTIAPSFCQSKGYGNHADPARCDSYIACDKAGRGVRMACVKGLYYNSEADLCDFPANVKCDAQGICFSWFLHCDCFTQNPFSKIKKDLDFV